MDRENEYSKTQIQNAPQNAIEKQESSVIDVAEQIKNALEPSKSESIEWMGFAAPLIKPGGKPVAIILALGAIAIPLIPLAMMVNWVAGIIAVGAVAFAIIVACRSQSL